MSAHPTLTVSFITISVAAEARGDALARLDGVAQPRLDVEAGERHRRLPQARLRRRLQPRRQAARAVGRAAQLGPEAAPVEPGGAASRALENGESSKSRKPFSDYTVEIEVRAKSLSSSEHSSSSVKG